MLARGESRLEVHRRERDGRDGLNYVGTRLKAVGWVGLNGLWGQAHKHELIASVEGDKRLRRTAA